MTTTIYARQSMLAESYGAHLCTEYDSGYAMVLTDNITEPTDEMLACPAVWIIGGYYKKHYSSFKGETFVFLNNCDEIPEEKFDNVKFVMAKEGKSFLDYVCDLFGIKDEHVLRICRCLENYAYDYPEDESMNFQSGVYALEGATCLEKLLKVHRGEISLEEVMEKGKVRRMSTMLTVQTRCKTAVMTTISFKGKEYSAIVANGDSPVNETLVALLKSGGTDVAILLRYDMKGKKTFISLMTSKGSGIRAGVLARERYGGGGSIVFGGGDMDGFVFSIE